MKHWTAFLLAFILLLSLFAGCASTPPAETPQTPSAGDMQTPETPEVPEVPEEPETPAEPEAPTWTEPVYTIENTLENRQEAILAVAQAYFNKGTLDQYGLQYITTVREDNGGNLRGRTLEANTPEEATPDQTLYQWCSSYAFDVMYNAFGYRLLDSYVKCRTINLSAGVCGTENNHPELIVYQYECTGDQAKDQAAANELYALLQPGDIITYTLKENSNGHTILYFGDLDGDGMGDILHRTGVRYDMETGEDKIEGYGIKLASDAKTCLTMPGAQFYLPDYRRFSVYRITNLDPAQYPITNATMARMTYPGLRIDRTVNVGVHGSVESGGELTYSIKLVNYSKQDHIGMPVMDAIPENCTLVSVDGEPTTAAFPMWTVDLKAGRKTVLTYTVRVDGKPGDTVISCGGSVAGIPSNKLTTTIQAFTPEASKLQDEAALSAALSAAGTGSDASKNFANALYNAAFGKDPQVGNAAELLEAAFGPHPQHSGTYVPLEAPTDPMAAMIIPLYYGGTRVITDPNGRVLETLLKDMQAGDIIVSREFLSGDPAGTTWIFDGKNLVTVENGSVVKLDQVAYTTLLKRCFFCALRPSLAG